MKIADSSRRDKIHHDEEYILGLIERYDLDCPTLARIWEAFYAGPKIYPNLSQSIVNELDLMNSFLTSHTVPNVDPKKWSESYLRLRDFFADAHKRDSMVTCLSD